MKTYVIAAQHGDEVFGLKVAAILHKNHNPEIRVRIGHPEAIAKQTRFIENDLNRSFQTVDNTLESRLAYSIQSEIDEFKPDYIIDLHTSVSNVNKVAIVAKHCAKTTYLAQAMGMQAIVIMSKSITKHSLIGCFPGNAISIELGNGQRSDKLAQSLAKSIESLEISSKKNHQQLPVFKVVSTIDKDFAGLDGILNLEFNPELGGYPFLAGTNTYSSIGGFLAHKVKRRE